MDDLDRWARLLITAADEQATQPGRICELCVQMLDVSGAGISMVTKSGHRGVVCATDDTASKIEDLQITVGVGPCIDAISAGGPVMVADLDELAGQDLSHWTGFTDLVRGNGVRAVFAFPLQVGASTIGALDLYRDRPGAFSAPQLAAAGLAAEAAALALLHLEVDGDGAVNVDGDAAYRLEIHQATGMVAVQLGITLEQAMLRLRARAFAEDRSLAEVSADVVSRHVRFTREDT